jgi:hypothetical protein
VNARGGADNSVRIERADSSPVHVPVTDMVGGGFVDEDDESRGLPPGPNGLHAVPSRQSLTSLGLPVTYLLAGNFAVVMIPGGIATQLRAQAWLRPRGRHDPWRDRNQLEDLASISGQIHEGLEPVLPAARLARRR